MGTGHFLRIRQWGGIYKKGPYYTECGEMIDGLLVTKSLVWPVSHLIVGGGGGSGAILPHKIFVFFYPYDRLATSRPWGREGAGKGTRDPSDEVASGRLVSLAGI